jgi:carbamoyl-phosphate synthase large subunit
MDRILIGGAGGAASEGVIRSIKESKRPKEIIGMGSEFSDLVLSKSSRRFLIPPAGSEKYWPSLKKLIEIERPAFIHVQNDREVLEISRLRDDLGGLGVKTFLPSKATVETCVDKWKTYEVFRMSNIKVPQNLMINSRSDVYEAFESLGGERGMIWIRSNAIGGGGKGSLPTNDPDFAIRWIDNQSGWGNFMAAELLSKETVTWSSLWNNGSLVVAQTRKRVGWIHGNRTLSGVTGVTKVGSTTKDSQVDEIAQKAVLAVDKEPHGLFGVDMTYDFDGIPNPTEINIGRFFTTIYFFTKAGLNIPEIYLQIGLSEGSDYLGAVLNPLPVGLHWFRAVDSEPILLRDDQLPNQVRTL